MKTQKLGNITRGKIIAANAYINKRDISQINNLTFHLKKLEKEMRHRKKLGGRPDTWNEEVGAPACGHDQRENSFWQESLQWLEVNSNWTGYNQIIQDGGKVDQSPASKPTIPSS